MVLQGSGLVALVVGVVPSFPRIPHTEDVEGVVKTRTLNNVERRYFLQSKAVSFEA